MMRNSNPVFSSLERRGVLANAEVATHAGITLKTLILFAVTLISGFGSIFVFQALPIEATIIFLALSGLFAFIFAMIATFSVRMAPIFSILYAVTQGLTYGLITYIIDLYLPGVALMALTGTGIVFLVMFTLYRTGILRASGLLRSIVIGGLLTFLIGSLVLLLVSVIDPVLGSAIGSNIELGIGISLFLIVIGAFMLTLDFDRADRVVAMGLDKRTEWQVGLGLLVTLIMIYYNILRLIVLVMARNRR
ncbi:MAG TPA: Bax inhibitor-1/YccA family protein [Acholeplasma sp.]|jgi:uncharacterized YccA/Bax inhibitor family protein